MLIIQNILWLLVLIGAMILVHELGHFAMARLFDVRVDTFSFGFGPRLFGFKRGETDFRISAVPFGGYVKMAGEQPGEESVSDPRAFLAKPRGQRLLIAFAGPFMNVVLAVALLAVLFMFKYPKPMTTDLVATIGHIMPDSPAAKAGLQEGDRIVRLDGKQNPIWEDVAIAELSNADRPLDLTVVRNGKQLQARVIPTLSERTGVGYAGWSQQADMQVAEATPGMPAQKAGLRAGDLLLSVDGQQIRSPYKLQEVIRGSGGKPVAVDFIRGDQRMNMFISPAFSTTEKRWMIGVALELRVVYTQLSAPQALVESVRQNVRGAGLIVDVLSGIVARRMSAKSIDGPIGIAQLSGDAARAGAYPYINLMSAVSLNLAIINLLPIPILDGGVILMLLLEMLLRRDLSLPVKEAAFKFGLVFLLMVMAFAMYNDIVKLLPAG